MCIGLGEVDEEGSKEESKTSPDLDLKLDPLDRILGSELARRLLSVREVPIVRHWSIHLGEKLIYASGRRRSYGAHQDGKYISRPMPWLEVV
jgi:hypothetical protein